MYQKLIDIQGSISSPENLFFYVFLNQSLVGRPKIDPDTYMAIVSSS